MDCSTTIPSWQTEAVEQPCSNRTSCKDAGLQFAKRRTQDEDVTEFMGNVIETGHAELAPTLSPVQKYWYLQVFGVTHPQKPDQIRCVFDSSAKHENLSLNGVLLTGPDLTNSLLGVLVSFRREAVAITADIQQMFYCFNVSEDHMNYLRFLWNKDLSNSLVEYRMCVQVFGNSPSPAIVTYEKISGTQW